MLLVLTSGSIPGGGGGADAFPAAPARWKTGTLARCAISTSPICQCIASAALHGSCISFAIFSHMSFLNLANSQYLNIDQYIGKIAYLSYSRASLFFFSSSHSERRSR